MIGIMFASPNGLHESSSPIHKNDGQDPIGVYPMKSVPAHKAVGYYTNTEIQMLVPLSIFQQVDYHCLSLMIADIYQERLAMYIK